LPALSYTIVQNFVCWFVSIALTPLLIAIFLFLIISSNNITITSTPFMSSRYHFFMQVNHLFIIWTSVSFEWQCCLFQCTVAVVVNNHACYNEMILIWSQFADFKFIIIIYLDWNPYGLLHHLNPMLHLYSLRTRKNPILNPYSLQPSKKLMLDLFKLRPGEKPMLNPYRLRPVKNTCWMFIDCALVKHLCWFPIDCVLVHPC